MGDIRQHVSLLLFRPHRHMLSDPPHQNVRADASLDPVFFYPVQVLYDTRDIHPVATDAPHRRVRLPVSMAQGFSHYKYPGFSPHPTVL